MDSQPNDEDSPEETKQESAAIRTDVQQLQYVDDDDEEDRDEDLEDNE